MNLNLLEMAKPYLSTEMILKAGSFIGENPTATNSALNAVLPTVLGGIIQKGQSSEGGNFLMEMFKQNGSADLLDSVTGLLGNGNEGFKNILSFGLPMLQNLFGDKLDSTADMIASFSGIKKGSASTLMSMAAPLLMGLIGRQVTKDGLGLSDITSFLSSQTDHLKAAMPKGISPNISNVLGIAGLGNNVSEISSVARNGANQPTEEKSKGLLGLLPLFGSLILGGGFILLCYQGCGKNAPKVLSKTSEATPAISILETPAATTNASVPNLGAFVKTKLSSGVELNIPQNGIENNLINFIQDNSKAVDKTTWFSFDRLQFETGKATLKPESQEQLKNIAEIMAAFPQVEIKLGGYTDNVGSDENNMKLSDSRAKSVMAELVKLGVAANRMAAEGYGKEHPVASNDTEAGRAQNRRIDVRVTKK